MNEIVKLEGVNFPPEYHEALQFCEKIGLNNSMIMGGALRDAYMGNLTKVHDFDIMADFAGSRLQRTTPQETAQTTVEALEQQQDVTDPKIAEAFDRGGRKAIKILFNYRGREIDLFATGNQRPVANVILESDAPINSIGMNSKGEVFAHPDFRSHADGHIYAPFASTMSENVVERFDHLRKKIPDLKMETTELSSATNEIALPHRPSRTHLAEPTTPEAARQKM